MLRPKPVEAPVTAGSDTYESDRVNVLSRMVLTEPNLRRAHCDIDCWWDSELCGLWMLLSLQLVPLFK